MQKAAPENTQYLKNKILKSGKSDHFAKATAFAKW